MVSVILHCLLLTSKICASASSHPERSGNSEATESSTFRLNSWKCNEFIDSESVVIDLTEDHVTSLVEIHVVHDLPGEVELQDGDKDLSLDLEKSSADRQLHQQVRLNYSIVDVGRGSILIVHLSYVEDRSSRGSYSFLWLVAFSLVLIIPMMIMMLKRFVRDSGDQEGKRSEEEGTNEAVDSVAMTTTSKVGSSSNPTIFSIMSSYDVSDVTANRKQSGSDAKGQSSSDANDLQATPSVQPQKMRQIRSRVRCSTPGNSAQLMVVQCIFVCCALASCPPPGSPPTSRLLLNIPPTLRLERVKLFFPKRYNNPVHLNRFSSSNSTRVQIFDLDSLEDFETFTFCSQEDTSGRCTEECGSTGGKCWNQRVVGACSTCGGSSFQLLPCTKTSDRKCLHITGPRTTGDFQSGPRLSSKDVLISASSNVFFEQLYHNDVIMTSSKDSQWGFGYRVDGNQSAATTGSENVTFSGLGNVGEIKLKRNSGLEVVVKVESLEVPHHFEDVEYVSDNRFMLEKQDSEEKKKFNYLVSHVCRHPIPDFYTITLEMARDRATAAEEVTCQSEFMEEKCPDGIKEGQVYLRRSLSSPCSLMGAHPEPLGREFNSIYCTERTSLLTRIFGKTHSPERSIRFPAKKCRLPIFRCEQCLSQARCSEMNHFASMCCQVDCYALPDCKMTFIDECKNNPVICGMGDTYRYTLEPVFFYLRSNYSCHVRRSNRFRNISSDDNWVYRIQFHARIASLHLSSPLYVEYVSFQRNNQRNRTKLQVAFMELEHHLEREADLKEDEYIIHGREESDGRMSYHVTNVKKEIPSEVSKVKDGFSGVEQTSPSSYVAFVQFDEPFLYSSSTWNATDTCHKNTSRMLPWHKTSSAPRTRVESSMAGGAEAFHYFLRKEGSSHPKVTFKLRGDRSVLAHWFVNNDAHLLSSSVKMSMTSQGKVKILVLGVMTSCPAHLRVSLAGLQTSSTHDLLISCPPSFNLTFHVTDIHPSHVSSFLLQFSTSFRTSTVRISSLNVNQVRKPEREIFDLDSWLEDVKGIQRFTFFTAFWIFLVTLLLSSVMMMIFSCKPRSSKWTPLRFCGDQFNRDGGVFERQKKSNESKTTSEKIGRHQSSFPGEYSALRPDAGGKWRPPCGHQLQPSSPHRDQSRRASTPQKSARLVLVFHFLFWIAYSLLFTLSVFFSSFIGLLNSDGSFHNAGRLSIAIQNWTQSVVTSLESNMHSMTSKRFSKLTRMTDACENHISEVYEKLSRDLRTYGRRTVDWNSFQTPYARIFDDFVLNYSRVVSSFLRPAFVRPVMNLTISPSSRYQKYLRRGFRNDWLAFPGLLFGKMRHNLSSRPEDQDLIKWCRGAPESHLRGDCHSLETNSRLGEFLEVEEIRPVQQWMALFLARFQKTFNEAMFANFSTNQKPEVRVSSPLIKDSKFKLDSRHFVRSSATNSPQKENLFLHLLLDHQNLQQQPPPRSEFDAEFHKVRLVFLTLDLILLVFRMSQALLNGYVLVTCLLAEKVLQRRQLGLAADPPRIHDEETGRVTGTRHSVGRPLIPKYDADLQRRDLPLPRSNCCIKSNNNNSNINAPVNRIKRLQPLLPSTPAKPFLSSKLACRAVTCASFLLILFHFFFTFCSVWKSPHPVIQSALFEVASIVNGTHSSQGLEEIDFFQNMLSISDSAQLLEIQNSKVSRDQLLPEASDALNADSSVQTETPCSYISAEVCFTISLEDPMRTSDFVRDMNSLLQQATRRFLLLCHRVFVLLSVVLSLMFLLNTAMFLLVSSGRKKMASLKSPGSDQSSRSAQEPRRTGGGSFGGSQCFLPSEHFSSTHDKIGHLPPGVMALEQKVSGSVEHNTIRLLWNEFKISETHV